MLDCFTESKPGSTENCQGPALGLIIHLVHFPDDRSELSYSCTGLHGCILLELAINNEPQILLFHLGCPVDLRKVGEAIRNYTLCPIRTMMYETHERITFY